MNCNPRGANRMNSYNWERKFPAQLYETLFRFRKADIDVVIAALEIPAILHFDSRHQSNRYNC